MLQCYRIEDMASVWGHVAATAVDLAMTLIYSSVVKTTANATEVANS